MPFAYVLPPSDKQANRHLTLNSGQHETFHAVNELEHSRSVAALVGASESLFLSCLITPLQD